MTEFLKQAGSRSKLFDLEFKTKTKLDRGIPVVFYPRRNQWKKYNPTVMIFAQQHGNELSGKEALLMLIYEIYLKFDLTKYQSLNLILIPMANPDGNEAHQRRNNNSVDLNRNHLILTEP